MHAKETKKKLFANGAQRAEDESPFGDVVFRYTRAQAIEDGVLIDVSQTARECGIVYPVALTQGAWSECVSVSPDMECQDETGRLWDVLNVLRFAIQGRQGEPSNRVDFRVQVLRAERKSDEVNLYALCGPGDNAEPVLTVMLPNED